MNTILDTIIAHKREELVATKQGMPLEVLKDKAPFENPCRSIKQALLQHGAGIIAEFKRRSPSRPNLNLHADIAEHVRHYENSGAAAISVLTDQHFFGGSLTDFETVRSTVKVPLLRKDFIVDPYQVYEAKAHGADVILLIAAVLEQGEMKELASLANELGMEVLLEIREEEELAGRLSKHITMVGVNNRNLKTFEVDVEQSVRLVNAIPDEFVKVSESGISSPAVLPRLIQLGYQGFLIGEALMKERNTCQEYHQTINNVHQPKAQHV